MLPGGGPGAPWERSWDHFGFQGRPRGVSGTAGDEKELKTNFATPPQGPIWEAKFGFFFDFVGICFIVLLSVVLEGLRVEFYADLGRFLDIFLNIFE